MNKFEMVLALNSICGFVIGVWVIIFLDWHDHTPPNAVIHYPIAWFILSGLIGLVVLALWTVSNHLIYLGIIEDLKKPRWRT